MCRLEAALSEALTEAHGVSVDADEASGMLASLREESAALGKACEEKEESLLQVNRDLKLLRDAARSEDSFFENELVLDTMTDAEISTEVKAILARIHEEKRAKADLEAALQVTRTAMQKKAEEANRLQQQQSPPPAPSHKDSDEGTGEEKGTPLAAAATQDDALERHDIFARVKTKTPGKNVTPSPNKRSRKARVATIA